MVLREIANFSSQGDTPRAILDGLKFRKHSVEEIDEILEAWTDNWRNPGEVNNPHQVYLKFGNWRSLIHVPRFRQSLQNPDENINDFAQNYAARHCSFSMGQAELA